MRGNTEREKWRYKEAMNENKNSKELTKFSKTNSTGKVDMSVMK